MNNPSRFISGLFIGSFCALTPIIDSRQDAPSNAKPLYPAREIERTKLLGASCCIRESL